MNEDIKLYTHRYFLTAAQCNAQKELPPAMLAQHVIEVATEHADLLGVGYSRLKEDSNLWVLSRMAVEVKRYPRMFETYSLSTWIEDYNRHFSERNFEIKLEDGEVLGYARTIWMPINVRTRRPADLDSISGVAESVCDKMCPIAKISKIRPVKDPQISNDYTFQVTDIDFNRHVNSARYIELIVNQFSIRTYDEYILRRFEIVYSHEAHFGHTVSVRSHFEDDAVTTVVGDAETTYVSAKMMLVPRPDTVPGDSLLKSVKVD